eukprot:3778884-Pyramimonas_sp.AAC.1
MLEKSEDLEPPCKRNSGMYSLFGKKPKRSTSWYGDTLRNDRRVEKRKCQTSSTSYDFEQ